MLSSRENKSTQSTHTLEEARAWFVLMHSGSVTDAEQREFFLWLHENESHNKAYQEYEKIWNDLATIGKTSEAHKLRASLESKNIIENFLSLSWNKIKYIASGKKHILKNSMALASLAILFVAVFGIYTLTLATKPIEISQYVTGIGEIKKITLDDGTEITLGAKSTLNAWSTKTERHAALVDGQAFFSVSKNLQRPFFVNSGNTLIRVVGTQFDVRKGAASIRVAVQEGIVKVSGINSNKLIKSNLSEVTLTAAQQITHIKDNEFENSKTISIAELESWRNGRLIYQRANLADVVADANRYGKNKIYLESPSLQSMKVTAAISVEKMDSLIEMLTKSLPITARHENGNIIIRGQ